MLANKLIESAGAGTTYVDDVFSTYLYTGSGSTQTINNGIDLAGKGGMVWIKDRSGAADHAIYDTARGATYDLVSNSTAAQTTQSTGVTAFSSSGFSIGSLAKLNSSNSTYATWTFRKSPKFFDVVTYTGNGVAGRAISHSLGAVPGMIIFKSSSGSRNWCVWHKSVNSGSGNGYLFLQATNAETNSASGLLGNGTNYVAPTSTQFTIGSDGNINYNSESYVAYIFAHDTASDGLIQCGVFTTDGSGNATVSLGWEPQFAMLKSSSTTGNWITVDAMRGMPVGNTDAQLYPNLVNNEGSASTIDPNASGFSATALGASTTYIYLAIRRPNKPPTSGTEVYNAWTFNGTDGFQNMYAGFPPDTVITYGRSFGTAHCFVDRNRGSRIILRADSGGGTQPESLAGAAPAFTGGYYGNRSVGTDNISTTGLAWFGQSGISYVYHFFRRAPGFFDVVCYTGTGVFRTVNHNLGGVPELMIVKGRGNTENWAVYVSVLGATKAIYLNNTGTGQTSNAFWNDTAPTSSVFSVLNASTTNSISVNYVAYLFATLPGISKVGSYTGNGSSQTINCGFGAGARFVLIKRTDSTGDWYIWDTARGIATTNDPHLSLNTTAAEVTTDDSIDPDSTGFIVNQLAATNINVSSATYIYLAIA